MERKSYYLIIVQLYLLHTLSAVNGNSPKIYEAYLSGNMKQWKTVIVEMQKQKSKSNATLLDEINYQYGYIGWCIGTEKKEEAKTWMQYMEKNLDILEQKKYEPSMTASYRGSMIGFRIGLNKLQAPFIGGKSIAFAKSAMELDTNNPLGFQLNGNILFYSPEVLGGSKSDAMKQYLLALKKMDSQPLWKNKNWNYLSLLTVIATAYYEIGEADKALLYLKKALTIAPNFEWAKNELYPRFQQHK